MLLDLDDIYSTALDLADVQPEYFHVLDRLDSAVPHTLRIYICSTVHAISSKEVAEWKI